jgi:hypothetical protein
MIKDQRALLNLEHGLSVRTKAISNWRRLYCIVYCIVKNVTMWLINSGGKLRNETLGSMQFSMINKTRSNENAKKWTFWRRCQCDDRFWVQGQRKNNPSMTRAILHWSLEWRLAIDVLYSRWNYEVTHSVLRKRKEAKHFQENSLERFWPIIVRAVDEEIASCIFSENC